MNYTNCKVKPMKILTIHCVSEMPSTHLFITHTPGLCNKVIEFCFLLFHIVFPMSALHGCCYDDVMSLANSAAIVWTSHILRCVSVLSPPCLVKHVLSVYNITWPYWYQWAISFSLFYNNVTAIISGDCWKIDKVEISEINRPPMQCYVLLCVTLLVK